jgi:hypothetical protein
LLAAQAALACCVESAATDENKSMKTNRYLVKLALAATTLAGALQLSTALAQDSQTRTIEQYTCKDIMREAGADRDIAIAFLHGFLWENREQRASISTFCINRRPNLLSVA